MMRGSRSGNASVAGFMPDLLALPFLICAAVACIAGMVRGFAGFGAAMIMTPVFSALYGPAVGVPLCLLLEIVVVLPLLPGGRAAGRLAPHRPRSWPPPWWAFPSATSC